MLESWGRLDTLIGYRSDRSVAEECFSDPVVQIFRFFENSKVIETALLSDAGLPLRTTTIKPFFASKPKSETDVLLPDNPSPNLCSEKSGAQISRATFSCRSSFAAILVEEMVKYSDCLHSRGMQSVDFFRMDLPMGLAFFWFTCSVS